MPRKYKITRTSYGVLVEGKERHDGKWVEFKAKCNHNLLEFDRMRSDMSWTKREWVHLDNGHWRCSRYSQDSGYIREHKYDLATGRVISEIDTAGNKNLLDKRVTEIQSIRELSITDTDYFISLELENEIAPKQSAKTNPLF